ncbi:DUF3102 domain-containing protein [Frateuria soli]|uniref:DUF3102 domain-containing protein n=1 Tax=Frateuria soli TaxID=1542730 RepID=UPI001E2ACFE1|nr:DUF3102 domain-containing protein [Frateuria soli]UGB39120.1 DUF3102 domain-containing protein [Frateuria soli]
MTGASLIAKTAELDELAISIRDCVESAERYAGQAVCEAVSAGRLLARAKQIVPRGEWVTWVTANTPLAVRTAQAYMRLSSKLASLPDEEAQRVALLPIREAMKAITTDPTAPTAMPPMFVSAREPRERYVSQLKQTMRGMNAFITRVNIGELRHTEIEKTRHSLTTALATLDMLEAEFSALSSELERAA